MSLALHSHPLPPQWFPVSKHPLWWTVPEQNTKFPTGSMDPGLCSGLPALKYKQHNEFAPKRVFKLIKKDRLCRTLGRAWIKKQQQNKTILSRTGGSHLIILYAGKLNVSNHQHYEGQSAFPSEVQLQFWNNPYWLILILFFLSNSFFLCLQTWHAADKCLHLLGIFACNTLRGVEPTVKMWNQTITPKEGTTSTKSPVDHIMPLNPTIWR